MKGINPYLNFSGQTEEVFEFYRSVFGGEFASVVRFKDSPEAGNVSAEDSEKLMHISLPVGGGLMLMGTDTIGARGENLVTGNNFYLNLITESESETKRIYDGLSAGGKIEQKLDKMFWGAYFGMFTDKYGIKWMLSYDLNTVPA